MLWKSMVGAILLILPILNITAAPFAAFQIGTLPETLYPSEPLEDNYRITFRGSASEFYCLSELRRITSQVDFSARDFAVRLEAATFGWQAYREIQVRFSGRFRPTPCLAVGAGVSGLLCQVEGRQSPSRFGIDLFCQVIPDSRLSIEMELININQPGSDRSTLATVPMSVRTGMIWRSASWLSLGIFGQSEEENGFYTEISVGLHFQRIHFCLAAGYPPGSFSLHASLQVGKSRTTVGFSAVQGLGEQIRTVGAELTLCLKKKKTNPLGKVDINSAGPITLLALQGMTANKAAAVIARRKLYGPFIRTVDICRVRGISGKMFQSMKKNLAVNKRGDTILPVREKPKTIFRINSAEMRDCLRAGFTPSEALRLLLFRKRLGGFRSIRDLQLLQPSCPALLKKIGQLYED